MKSKFTWILTLFLAFFIQSSFAQEKTITGTITETSGLPLPGVGVKVSGTSQGTQSDMDGRYSIKASVGQKLVFEFIGMKTQTINVTASTSVLSVTLADNVETMDDVVIEAFRNTTKAKSNVASTTVTSKTIEGRPNASFMQTLQAQIPGLNISTGSGQPGANSTVILRGYGSINGNVEPLYVIDGVPLNSDNFRSINPNDIESVSVLKDAGATSVYGNRGANGVIIVKTKKGSFDAPLQVRYTSVSGFSTLQDNDYGRMNAKQALALENRAGTGYGSTLTQDQINNYSGVNTDWYNELMKTGVSINQNLSLTSGSKNLSSFTSIGYFEQEGIVDHTDLKRFNFRNNLNGKSNDGRFNYSTTTTINYSVRNEASNLGLGSININPVIGANTGMPYIDPNLYTTGDGATVLDYYQNGLPGGIGGGGTLLASPLMLLDRMRTATSRTNELKMLASVQGSYKLTDDLTFGGTFGADYTQAVGLNVQTPGSFNSLLFQDPGEEFLGFQTESYVHEFLANTNAFLTYSKTFAEKHTIEASVFTEYYKAHLKSFSYTQNGLDPKVFEPGNGGGFIPFNPANPNFYQAIGRSGKATAGLFSYFGTFDYDYDSKYGVSASFRRDASYRFADSNRWGSFWSVSGRWNIDQEAFMENSGFNMLKLRASHGTTGNQNIAGQSIFSAPNRSRTLFASATGYANQPSYITTQIGNDDLKWETIEQTNIGLDFALVNNRLRGTFDVYRKTTFDLYQSTQISAINSTYSIDANNGTLRNTGIEALVAYDVVSNKDFTLTLNFNGSYNKNELVDLPAGDDDLGNSIRQIGGALGQYYMVRYAGVNPANGELLFLDANGAITEAPTDADRVKTGKSFIPSYQGGFGFDAKYKGFFMTTQFSFVADIWRIDYDLEGMQDPSDIGVSNKSTDLFNAWTPDNRFTDIPSLGVTNKGFDANSDRYLKDASYVRLRYVSLGYDFDKKFLDKTFISGVRVYAQVENLFTWSKWRGWDAESPRGNDQYQYPTPRIFSLGLEIEL